MSVVDDAGEQETAQTQAEGPRARERQGAPEDAADAPAIDARERPPRRRAKRIAIAALGGVALAGVAVAGWPRGAGHDDPACTNDDARWTGVWDGDVQAAVARAFAATNAPFADAATTNVTAILNAYRAAWNAMRTEACSTAPASPEAILDLRLACLDRRFDEARALTSVLVASPEPAAVAQAVDAASTLTPVARCADVTGLRANAPPADPAQRARRAELEARIARLTALRTLGHTDDILGPARAIVAEARTTGDARVLAEALGLVGVVEANARDPRAAETLEQALHHARDSGDPELFATATVRLAESLSTGEASLNREGLGVARVAHAIVDGAGDPALAIRLLIAEGHLQLALGHRDLALPVLQRAAEKSRELAPENEMLRLYVDRELAWALVANMFHAEARAKYEAVIATATRLLGSLHPITVAARIDRCHAAAGIDHHQRDAAPSCYEPALRDGDRVLGPSSRGMLVARAYYAANLVEIGRRDRAREVYAEALAHVTQNVWTEQWSTAADLARGLGRVELVQGDYKSALDHCSLARDNQSERRGFSDDTCIAEAQLGLGRAPAALAILEPMAAKTDGKTKEELGPWSFAYARAVWAVRHDANVARALALRARRDLQDRADVDAWLAKLPR